MSTPTPNVWTLNASGITPAGKDGIKLVGCHIKFNSGTYLFTEPNINNVLASYTPPTPAPTSFTFPQFTYDKRNWSITVNLPLTSGANGSGTWAVLGKQAFATPMPPPPASPNTNGEYTAQAGSGLGGDEDAISANA